MNNQNENSPRQISDRAAALVRFMNDMNFTSNEVIDVYVVLSKKFDYLIDSFIKSESEDMPDELYEMEIVDNDGNPCDLEDLLDLIEEEQEGFDV